MTTSTHDTQRLEAAIHRVRGYAIARVNLMARRLLTQASITSGRSISTLTTEDIVNYLQITQRSSVQLVRRTTSHKRSAVTVDCQGSTTDAIAPRTLPLQSPSLAPQRPHRSQEDFEQSLNMLDILFSNVSADNALN
jgi:hypothetical protein